MQSNSGLCAIFCATKISPRAVLAFFLSCGVFSILIFLVILHRMDLEKKNMEHIIVDHGIKITEKISHLVYKTQALSTLVIQSNGQVKDFARVAAIIMDDPAMLNIILAPGGVVSHVYPYAGNEAVLHYNLLGAGAGNKEAMLAKERGQLVFGGPFNLVQGGQALVGRLPVWLGSPEKGRTFWGLVSVTLKYPQVLRGIGLEALETQGLAYEIWRVSPDDNQRQIIASSDYAYNRDARFVERRISILNSEWYFRILPLRHWYEYLQNWALIIMGLGVSLLAGVLVQSNCNLQAVKCELENMVLTDSLTGLLNRKGMLRKLESLIAAQSEFRLFYLDLNHFKHINDTYGHNLGDYVLISFSQKLGRHLGPESIFARISGDEFVLILPGEQSCEDLAEVWRNIDREFEAPMFKGQRGDVRLTFSRGMAVFPEHGLTVDDLLFYADKQMYEEKHHRYAADKTRRYTDFRTVADAKLAG